MKKIMQAILTLAVFCFIISFGVYANGNIDSGVLDFEDNIIDEASLETYLQNTGWLSESAFENANNASVDNDSTIEPFVWSSGYEAEEFGTSVRIKRNSRNSALRVLGLGSGSITDNVTIEFSIKKTDNSNSQFVCEIRTVRSANGSSDSEYPLIFRNNGYVNLCGNDMVRYNAGVWYDVKLEINLHKAYTRLYLNEHLKSTWDAYDAFFVKDVSGNQINYDLSRGFVRIQLGYIGGENAETYVDNIRYYTKNTGDMTPTMNSFSDDFSGEPSYWQYQNGESANDYAKQWRGENLIAPGVVTSVRNKKIPDYDKNVMTLGVNVSPGYASYATLGKHTYAVAENAASDIKFGFGKSEEASQAQVHLIFDDGSSASVVNLYENELYCMGSSVSGIKILPGKIYECEIIYSRQKKTARLLFDTDSERRMIDLNLDAAKPIVRVDFQIVTRVSAELYVSDFRYDIAGDIFTETNKYIKSGFEKANLDDTAVFKYNYTIKTADMNDFAVSINKNGEAAEEDYTLKFDGNWLFITFDKLEKNSVYDVTVSGVEDLLGNQAEPCTLSFATADFDVKASKPVFEENTIKFNAKSSFGKGNAALIIAAGYDSDGALVEIVYEPITVTKRNGEDFDITPKFKKNPAAVRAFIWSDFVNVIPYGESAANN